MVVVLALAGFPRSFGREVLAITKHFHFWSIRVNVLFHCTAFPYSAFYSIPKLISIIMRCAYAGHLFLWTYIVVSVHLYCESIIITAVCHFSIPLSGHAPGRPTEHKHTLHIVLVRVAPATGVVFFIGVDAEGPHTSKWLIFYSCLYHMTVAVASMHGDVVVAI